MTEVWFLIALILAVLAVWVAWIKTPQWVRRTRISARLHRAEDEEDASGFWLSRMATRLTESSLAENDFKEIRDALAVTGRSREQAQVLYLLFCWLLPIVVILAGFLLAGALGGLVIAALAFLMPRWIIRGLGSNAEHRQNLEAVELCHITRMLMEAGLSLERVLRVVASQGRPMMPTLAPRIDRFNRLMESGAERSQALNELGENKRIPVLRNYVTLMKQSSQLGAGVSGSLQQIILEADETERNRIKEATNRIGAKMTVIMMLFMLPALFILIGGPAVVAILQMLNR